MHHYTVCSAACRNAGSQAALKRVVWDVLRMNRRPDQSLRRAWDVIQLLNVVVIIIMVPFFASFVDYGIGSWGHLAHGFTPWSVVMPSIDLLYLLDMVMQTRCFCSSCKAASSLY